MAKKGKASSSNSALVQMQKLANQTQVELQRMVNSANELQTRYNSEEAQKARDWQTNMSKTAHQMEVEDLKKAGLNPVLSAGGSGAQSYTTSSASATPESGASALAGVQSSQLSAIGNMESSRITAAAQRAAAASAAAATRYAAAQNAAATRYAAGAQAAAAKYQSDKSYAAQKYAADKALQIANVNKGGTIPGAIEKALTKAGIYDEGLSAIKNRLVAPAKKFFNTIVGNPNKYFSNSGKVTMSNFKLNNNGIKFTNNLLNSYGIPTNASNRALVIKAYVFGNQAAMNSLMKGYAAKHWQHGAKSKPRTGHL